MPLPRRTHCKKCNVELSRFNCNWARVGFNPLCKACQSEYNKEYKKKRVEDNPNYMVEKHWKSYGITPEEYNVILERQQFVCAICRQESDRNLCVDHNHETDEVRGLLCYKCNSILGFFNDDEDYVLKVIDYLKRTTWMKKLGLTFAQ